MPNRAIIVGAGPAGLFAAHHLAEAGLEVAIFDKGRDIHDRHCPSPMQCTHCDPCDVVEGVGGAGGMSDGKLNLHPKIGGDLTDFVPAEKALELIEQVDRIFLELGAPSGENGADPISLLRRAAACGIEFIPARQRHIGSDRLPDLIQRFKNCLEEKGVTFGLCSQVEDILVEGGICRGVRLKDQAVGADAVLLAPGRSGSLWLTQIAHRYEIPTHHLPIDVGVRVEVPAVCYEEAIQVNWDPKFRMHTPTYDDLVRTFCTNPNGFVIRERYFEAAGVNGHALHSQRSENTNFALLVRIALTEPVEDTAAYGYSISQLAHTLGGGAPIIQRLGDLKQGRRSTWNRINHSYVKPTLEAVTPGDISMALPHRVVTDIIEGLEMLDRVIPGVASASTLIYAPEIKFSSLRVITDKRLETRVQGLYVAGDGAGLSRDIINAAATGLIVADSILIRRG